MRESSCRPAGEIDLNGSIPMRRSVSAVLPLLAYRAVQVGGIRRAETLAHDDAAAFRVMALPWQRVPMERGFASWWRLPTLCGDDAIAVRMVRWFGVSGLQMLGNAMLTSGNLRSAIETLCRYFAYLCEVDAIECVTSGDWTTVIWHDNELVPPTLRHFVVGVLCDFATSQGLLRVSPVRVRLQDRDTRIIEAFDALTDCPVTGGRSVTEVTFPVERLSTPLLASDPHQNMMLLARLAPFDRKRQHLSRYVAGLVDHLLGNTEVTIHQVAAHLAVRPRTLQRKLAREGVRFSSIVGDVRRRRAARLLRETDLPVTSVAGLVGYVDPTSFHRAFVGWYGITPLAYRARKIRATPLF